VEEFAPAGQIGSEIQFERWRIRLCPVGGFWRRIDAVRVDSDSSSTTTAIVKRCDGNGGAGGLS
jgi:hypothetical protein